MIPINAASLYVIVRFRTSTAQAMPPVSPDEIEEKKRYNQLPKYNDCITVIQCYTASSLCEQ